jgi:membrane-bound lytic murein transglycosylase F
MRTHLILSLHIVALIVAEAFLVSLLLTSGVRPNVLRVAFIPGETVNSRLSPYGPGFDRELVEQFCRELHLSSTWIQVESARAGRRALEANRADLFIHTGEPAFTVLPDHLTAGPAYRTNHPILIHNRWKQDLLHPEEICDYTLPISRNPDMLPALRTLDQVLGCSLQEPSSPGSAMHPLLEGMTATRTRFAVVGAEAFQLWQPFFPEIRTAFELHHHVATRWIWTTRSDFLATRLAAFWSAMNASPRLQELEERYFGFFPATTDYYELSHVREILDDRLPRYAETIAQAARANDLDPLLVTALIYQESHFDSRATSRTGVRGLLQISRITASELGLSNRLDPEQSIRGGVSYLRSLMDRLEEQGLDPWTTLFFALAAYNQGMGHLSDAITLAEQLGRDGHSWREVKEVFPLLSYKKYFQHATYGYCRGIEAVDYVDSIRYYYYYLTGLVRLDRPESAYLAPLVDQG